MFKKNLTVPKISLYYLPLPSAKARVSGLYVHILLTFAIRINHGSISKSTNQHLGIRKVVPQKALKVYVSTEKKVAVRVGLIYKI